MRAGLAAAEGERDRIKGFTMGWPAPAATPRVAPTRLNKALESEKTVSSRALAQIEVLNQQISALRRQLAALEEALEAPRSATRNRKGGLPISASA